MINIREYASIVVLCSSSILFTQRQRANFIAITARANNTVVSLCPYGTNGDHNALRTIRVRDNHEIDGVCVPIIAMDSTSRISRCKALASHRGPPEQGDSISQLLAERCSLQWLMHTSPRSPDTRKGSSLLSSAMNTLANWRGTSKLFITSLRFIAGCLVVVCHTIGVDKKRWKHSQISFHFNSVSSLLGTSNWSLWSGAMERLETINQRTRFFGGWRHIHTQSWGESPR